MKDPSTKDKSEEENINPLIITTESIKAQLEGNLKLNTLEVCEK